MKKFSLMTVLVVLGLAFSACKEKPEMKWKNNYGYTIDEIAGIYAFSKVDGAFGDMSDEGCFACTDAEINIAAVGTQSIEFRINCPDEGLSRTFMGRPTLNSNDFLISMTSGYFSSGTKLQAYNLTAYVLENEAQEIRLHGFVALNIYKVIQPDANNPVADTIVDDGTYYYFDVIKN